MAGETVDTKQDQAYTLRPTSDDDDSAIRDASFDPWISPKKQEFFLPLTGFAWFYQEEVEIINHPAFQRLSNVNQLGQAHYVYRGATHKRIEHCLGVVSVAQKIISAIDKNADNARRQTRIDPEAQLSEEEKRFVRLGALLHDIGHIAAGHTLEDELGLIPLHDGDARLSLIFDKVDWPDYEFEANGCESLSSKVNRLYDNWLPPDLRAGGLSPIDVVRLLIRKAPAQPDDDAFAVRETCLKKSCAIRFHVCANIIGDTICADLLDYLYRDWYHVGRARSLNDRIFQYMEIRGAAADAETWHDKRSAEDSFVISLGKSPRIRTDGVSAILGLLEARYELAEAVLFHRTKLAAGAMLDRALFELYDGANRDVIVENLLYLSDEEVVDFSIRQAREKFVETREDRYNIAARVLGRLKGRRLYSGLVTIAYSDFPDGDRDYVKRLFSGAGGGSAYESAVARTAVARNLELDFRLSPGSIAIYCVEVRPKIAKVRIAVDDRMGAFDDLESEESRKNWLAGGHLAAQVNRFNRLMKMHFFIAREERVKIESWKIRQLESFIRSIVMKRGDLRQEVSNFASAIYMAEYHGKTDMVSFEPEGNAADNYYPNGAPRLWNYLRTLEGVAPGGGKIG